MASDDIDIYLDIDGVLLANDLHPAHSAAAFIQYVVARYPDTTYWLTTHCQGDANVPLAHIGHLFDAETVVQMRKIKPTTWDTAKTRAIDFRRSFLWFDDDLFYEERVDLLLHGAIENHIAVDLVKNPHQLGDFLQSFPIPLTPIWLSDIHLGVIPDYQIGTSKEIKKETEAIIAQKIKDYRQGREL